jgi:DNA-binding NarL/FixJ family response regulator
MGYSNIAIANQLGVSTDTIKTHTRNILGKFGISSRKELSLTLSNWDFSDWSPPTSRD